MMVNIPDKIGKYLDDSTPWLDFEGVEVTVREEAPEHIEEEYKIAKEWMLKHAKFENMG
ncbi:MAG: hypothetical protein ACOX4I_00385 [Anaerovoracaceae bacterium]|jgi:hypothetical protein